MHPATLAAQSGATCTCTTCINNIVARGSVMRDLKDTSEQPAVWRLLREASLERTDAVLEGDGCPSIHDW